MLVCLPLQILRAVLGEMAGLFTDDVFHIGSDETAATGRSMPRNMLQHVVLCCNMSHYVLGVAARRRCDTASTFAIERRMLTAITAELGKTPEVFIVSIGVDAYRCCVQQARTRRGPNANKPLLRQSPGHRSTYRLNPFGLGSD